jgi:SAM-dependent methyltransferase
LPHSRPKHRTGRLSPSYEVFGQFYDAIWGEKPGWPAWAAGRRQILRPVLSQVREVCDLGCGTGVNAIEFARRGLRVFALDFSREMCRLTRQRARAEKLDVGVRRADMRTFRLPVQVDLVTSEWGVINHLPRRADLGQTFRAVARALRPGGYFYFDLHDRKLYEDIWTHTYAGEGVSTDQRRKLFAVHRGGFDRKSGKGRIELDIFVQESRGSWKRHRERIEEIYWPYGQIVRDLRRTGFRLLSVLDFTGPGAAPSPKKVADGLRTIYLAQKER